MLGKKKKKNLSTTLPACRVSVCSCAATETGQLQPCACFQLGWTIKYGRAGLSLAHSCYSVEGRDGVGQRKSDGAPSKKGRLDVIWPSWACPHQTQFNQTFPEMSCCRHQQVLIKCWIHRSAPSWSALRFVFTSCPHVKSALYEWRHRLWKAGKLVAALRAVAFAIAIKVLRDVHSLHAGKDKCCPRGMVERPSKYYAESWQNLDNNWPVMSRWYDR